MLATNSKKSNDEQRNQRVSKKEVTHVKSEICRSKLGSASRILFLNEFDVSAADFGK